MLVVMIVVVLATASTMSSVTTVTTVTTVVAAVPVLVLPPLVLPPLFLPPLFPPSTYDRTLHLPLSEPPTSTQVRRGADADLEEGPCGGARDARHLHEGAKWTWGIMG